MLDIKAVFEKKYPVFYNRHRWLSQCVITIAKIICREAEFKRFTYQHPDIDGIELIQEAFSYLNFTAIINHENLAKIPASGRLIIILNHATALDGLGLILHLSKIRGDIKVVVNELLLTTGALKDFTIGVSMTTEGISKSSLQAIKQHLSQEGVLIIFPSGKPSRIYDGKIQDDRWSPSFLKMAKKYCCPILPVYVDGKYSNGFYFISKVCFPISTLLPIREVLNLRDKSETFYVGELIDPASIDETSDLTQQIKSIRDQLYKLSPGTDRNRL